MKFPLLACLVLMASSAFAQNKAAVNTKSGYIYFGFGTNLSWYSKSDIRFRTSTSDFTIYDVKAKDDGGLKFNGGGAPQYTYQAGYFNRKKNWGIEFNFDHIKYFATPGQRVRVEGTINGQKVAGDSVLSPSFVMLEHSDGANYALFSFVKGKNLWAPLTSTSSLDLLGKIGAGPVFPKTNSTVLNVKYDDSYQVSGYVVAAEVGLRYTFLKSFYLMPSLKASYANYTRFLIYDGRGSQSWVAGHFMIVAGGIIPIGK